jgi:hypothetical protein
MRTDTKRKMAIGATHQIEAISIGEMLRISVRSSQQKDEELPWPDAAAGELDLFWNAAGQDLERSVVPQQFFNGEVNRLGTLAEPSQLFWMLQ